MSMMQRVQSDPRPSVAAQWALADSQTRREILQCCARFSPDDFRAEAQAIDTIVLVAVERQDSSRGRRCVSTRVQERELTEFFGVHLSGINPMGTRTLASQGIHATLYLEEEEVDAQGVNGQAAAQEAASRPPGTGTGASTASGCPLDSGIGATSGPGVAPPSRSRGCRRPPDHGAAAR